MEKTIAKAIAHNEIREEDYVDCYADILYPIPDYPFINEEPLLVIILGPSTQIAEVERVFKDQIPELKREYQTLGMAPEYPAVDERGKSMIIRDREWYWLYQDGVSYKDIDEMLSKHKLEADHDGETCSLCKFSGEHKDVKKAVEKYEDWLYKQKRDF